MSALRKGQNGFENCTLDTPTPTVPEPGTPLKSRHTCGTSEDETGTTKVKC